VNELSCAYPPRTYVDPWVGEIVASEHSSCNVKQNIRASIEKFILFTIQITDVSTTFLIYPSVIEQIDSNNSLTLHEN
jgi:hypothetical protein